MARVILSLCSATLPVRLAPAQVADCQRGKEKIGVWNTITVFAERTIGWITDNCTPGDLVHARSRIRNGFYRRSTLPILSPRSSTSSSATSRATHKRRQPATGTAHAVPTFGQRKR